MVSKTPAFRVAVILPSLLGSGAHRYILRICECLLKTKKVTIDLVLMDAAGELLGEIPSGIRVIHLSCPHLWTSLPSLIRYLRSERPAAILSALPIANGIAAWARKLSRVNARLILSERDAKSLVFGDEDIHKFRHHILRLLIRHSYRFADGITAVSKGVAERLKTLPGVNPEKVHVVYNPTWSPMIDEWANEPLQHPWFTKKDNLPIILGVGRLEKQKDFHVLIHAFDHIQKLRPARLMILGEGKERIELENLVQRLGLRDLVELPGFVVNPFPYMKGAAVFVLSSVHEGFPNVLVEAMACGTAVVSMDCPAGPDEILDSGSYGSLVQVGDVNGLAAAIEKMLDSPPSPVILQNRAREFTEETSTAGYFHLLTGGLLVP